MGSSSGTKAGPQTATGPYKISWANRFSEWLADLPGSILVYCFGFWLFLTLLQVAALKVDGADPIVFFQVPQTFLAGAIAFMTGMFQHFNHRASTALAEIKPALIFDDDSYQTMEYRLTRLPMGGPLLAGLISILLIFLIESIEAIYLPEPLALYPLTGGLLRMTYYLCWGVFGVFVYQSLHRLVLIHRIFSQHTRVNLFNMSPLYALSNLTALTAASITVLPLGFLISNNLLDLDRLDPATIIVVSIIQVFAFLSFIWPHLGIHSLQRVEKERLLAEANQRYRRVLGELHQRVDRGQFDNPSGLTDAIGSLEMELARIERVHLWPWQPETMRWLLTALVLPIGFMILQRALV